MAFRKCSQSAIGACGFWRMPSHGTISILRRSAGLSEGRRQVSGIREGFSIGSLVSNTLTICPLKVKAPHRPVRRFSAACTSRWAPYSQDHSQGQGQLPFGSIGPGEICRCRAAQRPSGSMLGFTNMGRNMNHALTKMFDRRDIKSSSWKAFCELVRRSSISSSARCRQVNIKRRSSVVLPALFETCCIRSSTKRTISLSWLSSPKSQLTKYSGHKGKWQVLTC